MLCFIRLQGVDSAANGTACLPACLPAWVAFTLTENDDGPFWLTPKERLSRKYQSVDTTIKVRKKYSVNEIVSMINKHIIRKNKNKITYIKAVETAKKI